MAHPEKQDIHNTLAPRSRSRWIFAAGCLIFGLLVLLRIMNRESGQVPAPAGTDGPGPAPAATPPSNESRDRLFARLFLYGDRVAMLTHEDSNRAFQDYLSDFQRRLAHDREFPDEPRQVLPGENTRKDLPRTTTSQDGLVELTGTTAVMAVNERLLQMLLQKNPELSFGLEESFPLKSTYGDATLLGPITELRSRDPQNGLTAERAAQSIDYWSALAEQFRIHPDESQELVELKTYSKLAVAQANLFANRNFPAEAEQAYRIATQIFPANVEATSGLAGVLLRSGRAAEANQMLDEFSRAHPNQRRAVEAFRSTLQ